MEVGLEAGHGRLSCDSNNLSYQIFSALENNFLFGYDWEKERLPGGKVRILSIDGGGMHGIVAGRTLAYLEEALQKKTGDSEARIADFFDVVIGTGVGGLIAAMLFANDGSGRPLCRAEEVWRLLAEEGSRMFKPTSGGIFAKFRRKGANFSGKSMERVLKRLFSAKDGRSLTLKDTLKPILIPCYDLSSAAPFLFSRADALETDNFDFRLWEICRAAAAVPGFFEPVQLSSVDGQTICTAIDAGLVMSNPTAAAITHVVHHKQEFPLVVGVEDLLVLSVGTGQFDRAYNYEKVRRWGADQWAKPVITIVGDGISDTVDHAISMAFGQSRRNYVRIQSNGFTDKCVGDTDDPSEANVKMLLNFADSVLKQKGMESVPFGGKRKLSLSNAERLEWFADELVCEHRSRLSRPIPTVVLKQATRSH
uniref:Patatin n=1 Tax=Pinus tabuliformis TaxID=88731 RepID=A0A0K0M7E0_PINTB|nr:PLP2 [Pinus tabuliformis]